MVAGLVAAVVEVAALAAGDLKSIKTDGVQFELPVRADIAFTRDAEGKVHGAIQGLSGQVPASLLSVTPEWQSMRPPPLLPAKAAVP